MIAVLILTSLFALAALAKAVRVVPRERAGIVERLGRYTRSLPPGVHVLVPVIDRVRYLVDLREQVVGLAPQPVPTQDDRIVTVDTVIHVQVVDPVAASYQIDDHVRATEQLTTTVLHSLIGSMSLAEVLADHYVMGDAVRAALDEVTSTWGVRVDKVELKTSTPLTPRVTSDAHPGTTPTS